MSDPIEISYDNFSDLEPGMIVRVTGPVSSYCTSEGLISIGGAEVGIGSKCGLRIWIMNDAGTKYYELEAPSVSPNGYEDEFASHCAADVYYYPRYMLDTNYCGCTATIVGPIVTYTAVTDGEEREYIKFGNGTKIEYLNFYY